jgi:hypothetical protein
MLRHIVMMKFTDRNAVNETALQLKAMLLDLPEAIDSLIKMEVGLNNNKKSSAYDLVLTADFEDEAGLDAYRVHPAHVQVLDYLKTTMEKAAVVDYFI